MKSHAHHTNEDAIQLKSNSMEQQENNSFSHFQAGLTQSGSAHEKEEENHAGQSAFFESGDRKGDNISGNGELKEDQDLGGHGRTVGEAIGDAGRVVGTGLGNAFGDFVGLFTGIHISSVDKQSPTWSPNGRFNWAVDFKPSGKHAKNGWIVQRIRNTYRAKKTDGTAITVGGAPTLQDYWEAWSVDANGNVQPDWNGANDFWKRANRGPGTKGHWSMTGKVYFTKTDPATMGFTPGGAQNAGDLLSTYSEPKDLGIARLHRYAQGTWDDKGHEGSAK